MNEPTPEPSVLDYVKSRLNPWQKEKIEIPQPGEPGMELPPEAASQFAVDIRVPQNLPWRALAALFVALFAQLTLETAVKPIETQTLLLVLGAYTVAFGLLIWAFFIGEFSLPDPENIDPHTDPLILKPVSFILPIVLAGLAFTQFGKDDQNRHLFNPVNLTLWLGSIIFFVRGLWLGNPDQPPIWKRAWNWLKRDAWNPTITRSSILLVGVILLVVFFRFYRLEGVPGEPFSDQAEKLLDVYDVTQGQYHVFFERNTGREFIQFYWTALVAWVFNTGLTFMSLKIGTVLIGLFALPYTYLLGKEVGGPRVALFALLLAGTAYWLNVISRIGLRFPLYPAFAAPVLYHLVRGLRRQTRNDFILAGLFLGLGLHGYSPFRFVPFVVVLAVGLYLIHAVSKGLRKQTLTLSLTLVLASVLVFIPLMRYAIDRPDMFAYRALTRISGDQLPETPTWQGLFESFFNKPEQPDVINATEPTWKIFLQNTFNAMTMFNYDNGEIWVHSVPHRPALEIVSSVLFTIGYIFLFVRYLQKRDWLDLFLILAVPLLLMPSILSLAFPGENPSLNRTGAAAVVVFVVAAQALDGLYNSLRGVQFGEKMTGMGRQVVALLVVCVLLLVSVQQNYKLVFDTFATQYLAGAWNTSDMGRVIRAFVVAGNPVENAWVVPYPYWVDTRLVGIQTGYPTRDAALWPEEFPRTLEIPGNKMFILKDEDLPSLELLRQLYPSGSVGRFDSPLEGKDFWIYTVPDSQPIPQPDAPQSN